MSNVESFQKVTVPLIAFKTCTVWSIILLVIHTGKNSKTVVEDIPGTSPFRTWNKISYLFVNILRILVNFQTGDKWVYSVLELMKIFLFPVTGFFFFFFFEVLYYWDIFKTK